MGVGKSTFAFTNTAITLDGGSTTINITRDNQSYSHKISHGYGDIATLAVGTTSYTWEPTAAQLTKFFQEIPNQKTRQIDVYLDTYNGSTLVGRDVHAVTVTLSEVTGKPTISNFAINDDNATTKGWEILVYGKSTITASQSVSAKHGATITKTVYTYGGNEYSSIGDLIGSLPLTTTPTNYTIGCKTADSRGFATTASLTKSCAKYEAPTIDTLEMVRCDSSGNETEAGTKAKAIVKGSWASLSGKNTATFKIGYKLQNGTLLTYQKISVTNGIVDYEGILDATLDSNSDYLFAVSLVDELNGSFTEESIGFSNSQNIMYISADGEELILGSSSDGNILIGPDHVDIRKGEALRASFEATRLRLGGGYMELGYDESAGGYGSYLTSDWTSGITIGSPSGMLPGDPIGPGNKLVSSIKVFGGERPGIILSNLTGSVIKLYEYTENLVFGSGSSIISAGDWIHVSATKAFTYDIPVVTVDCNALVYSGKWCLGNGSTNRPIDKNGWLESMLYSDNYCHQTYTTYTGERYTRMMQEGTWKAWVDESTTEWQWFWKTSSHNYCGYRKKNGLVEVAASSAGEWPLSPKQMVKNYTLPVDCRPSVTIFGIGTEKDYRGYEVQFCIDTDGVIQIINLDPSNTTMYWGFNTTFIPG